MSNPRLPLTKIVATIGPASRDEAILGRLLDAGVSVVRLNFSHGTQEEHAETIHRVRELAAERDRAVALLQDLQGPKLRVGELVAGGSVELVTGATVTLTTDPIIGTGERISVTYERLGEDVRPGDRVLLDDGALELRVERIEASPTNGAEVVCRVILGGLLKPHKGVNLPGTPISAPALTPKDLNDLAFGIDQGVDYVALSFVRAAADIRSAREAISRLGGRQPLIAKIEKPEAIEQLEAIIRASDGVMVARGDLGVEMSPEAVPMLQKRIIQLANGAGVPVITATQMLESMIHHPSPTRAEASDVANAILDGTDAVMLSGETAIGAYPVETVQVMCRIAREVERDPTAWHPSYTDPAPDRALAIQAIAQAARSLTHDLEVRAIAVLATTGRTAQHVSKVRPGIPIVAFTEAPDVARQLALWGAINSIVTPLADSTDGVIAQIDAVLAERDYAATGDYVVIVGAAPKRRRHRAVSLEVHQME